MAEEFAFEEGFRDGTGINADHIPFPAGAAGVDFPRKDIFSRAVFPGNQDRGIGRSNLFDSSEDMAHFLPGAPIHPGAGFPGRSPRCSGFFPWDSLISRLEGGNQFLIVPWLHYKVKGPPLHAFHGQCNIGISSEKYHLNGGEHFLNLPRPVKAFIPGVYVGIEIHVQKNHIRMEILHSGDQGFGRRNQFHLSKMCRQKDVQGTAYALIVIHDEYLSFFCHRNVKVPLFRHINKFCKSRPLNALRSR